MPTTTLVPDPPVAPAAPVERARPAPPERDLTVDLLRALAIVAVAVGHWMVVVPSYDDGRFDGVNALATVPSLRPLTWLFQVMPLFFVVGGVANAASWSAARARGERYATWLRTRLVRLTRPVALLFGVGAGGAALSRAVGVPADVVEPIAWLVVVPVWFLAVYVLVVALAPALWRAHLRHGWWVVVALAGAAALVDAARVGGAGDGFASLNFVLVFGVCQQVGFAWYDGRLLRHRRRAGAALLGGGLASLGLLTHVGPFPVSLVGYPGQELANNAPPTTTLVALGLAQTGLALLARPLLQRALERRPVQAFALVLNRNAMSILLWHFTALVGAGVVLLPLGVVPDPAEGTTAWWVTRWATVAVLGLVLVPIVALVGRVERRPGTRPPASPASPWAPIVAVPLLAVAFALITLDGLSAAGPLGLPLVALGLFGVGTALAHGRPAPSGPGGGGASGQPSMASPAASSTHQTPPTP
ncbi:acyltransferase [Iamia sp. SCSIO 61187]|uniref:acyltransferase family protein n=1 Tax=Iamia sp. SCSIO 61187 TaxID=2722752 RepID=UPI001C6383FE|nr:acyltransferase [Iamia sp. SCSIO 61187]QYG94761.1 acyltransferase [Iamia sp. SCSIO 61187]